MGYWIALYIYALAVIAMYILVKGVDGTGRRKLYLTRALLLPVAIPILVIFALFMKDKNK